jgi:hypothetical protein
MDGEKWNMWLSLGANVGVLVGIIILGYEISQNTDMMRTQINQSRAELAMIEAQSIYGSDRIPELLTKVRKGAELDDVELERYTHLSRGFHRNWDNQLRQYREGFLEENTPRSIRNAILTEIAGNSTARTLWERTKMIYSDEYIAFVDDILAD